MNRWDGPVGSLSATGVGARRPPPARRGCRAAEGRPEVEVGVGGDRVLGRRGEIGPGQDRPGVDPGVDQVHRGADELGVALGQAPYAAVDPPVLGVIPAWILTNGASTHPSTDFAMIRVPFTTTTDGPSSWRMATVSSALTEVTVRSGG